jgi:hypothetical protein
MVTIAGSSGRWNPRVDAPRHEQILGDLNGFIPGYTLCPVIVCNSSACSRNNWKVRGPGGGRPSSRRGGTAQQGAVLADAE